MRFKSLTLGTAIVAIATPAFAVPPKDPTPKQLMEWATSCAYVVGIAEGNRVQLDYGTAEWTDVIRQLEEKTGLDSAKSLQLAKAKYNKRARVMGADETLKYIKSRAKSCDREMATIQS